MFRITEQNQSNRFLPFKEQITICNQLSLVFSFARILQFSKQYFWWEVYSVGSSGFFGNKMHIFSNSENIFFYDSVALKSMNFWNSWIIIIH